MDLTSEGRIRVPDAQSPVTETHRRVAEILSDYDPTLELHFIPPGSRGPLDVKPWAVVHRPCNGTPPYFVGFFEDADERLLQKIFSIDNKNKDVLRDLDAMNAAKEALRLKEEMESRMEAGLIAASVLRSKKIHYKHNGVDFGELR